MNKKILYILLIFISCIFIGFIFQHWFVFAFYLFLNLCDYITGSIKARVNQVESSVKGDIGILKKLCYWILILISFLVPIGFEEVGQIIDVDLQITQLLGWFIIGSLIINECRSIIENLVAIGCNVPSFLVKGLDTASKKINEGGDTDETVD